jgi:hypothetical protein
MLKLKSDELTSVVAGIHMSSAVAENFLIPIFRLTTSESGLLMARLPAKLAVAIVPGAALAVGVDRVVFE